MQNKDEQANKNLGDPSAFLNVFDPEKEADKVSGFMADGLNSHLEITSGTAYVLYQPWEFARLGAETPGEGLVIPLRAAFELAAQNIGERMVLRARVRETATGRTVYEKGAARFGVIRISRE